MQCLETLDSTKNSHHKKSAIEWGCHRLLLSFDKVWQLIYQSIVKSLGDRRQVLCLEHINSEDGGEERGFEEDTWAKPGLTQKALALSSNQSEPRRLHQKREVWREINLISLNRLIEEGLPGWQPGIQERVADWDEN
ncbi:hypothetical protein LOK49_Contig3G00021 [Camellia lanceoleosa]|nr:hypothetical protein LOK49_Contig3G00021 [Camellia lanceoleosa]